MQFLKERESEKREGRGESTEAGPSECFHGEKDRVDEFVVCIFACV